METIENRENETLDSYIKKIQDQKLKGILLKLKNEMRKPDTSWEIIRQILESLMNENEKTLIDVLPLILKDD